MAYIVVAFNSVSNVSSELQRIIDPKAVGGGKSINHEYSDNFKPDSEACFGVGSRSGLVVHAGFCYV